MKGRNPSAAEKLLWDRLAREVGCVACRKEGRFNDYVSVHHIAGRTGKDAHKKVLPLCSSHHQDDGKAVAVHPYKARFEALYGTQEELLAEAMETLRQKSETPALREQSGASINVTERAAT